MKTREEVQNIFLDRYYAGEVLAQDIHKKLALLNPIVIGLARGGVPVAYSVAKSLNAPLDILVVRKLGVPWNEELAFGAIAPDGVRVLNKDIVLDCHIIHSDIVEVERKERLELARRERLYRGDLPPPLVNKRTVLLVDDGLATGATMRAALKWAKEKGAAQCIVAAPVASQETCKMIEKEQNIKSCICYLTSEPMYAVGLWYKDFSQVDDETVTTLLKKRREEMQASPMQILRSGSTI